MTPERRSYFVTILLRLNKPLLTTRRLWADRRVRYGLLALLLAAPVYFLAHLWIQVGKTLNHGVFANTSNVYAAPRLAQKGDALTAEHAATSAQVEALDKQVSQNERDQDVATRAERETRDFAQLAAAVLDGRARVATFDAQMKQLDAQLRELSAGRKTIERMTTDHLGPVVRANTTSPVLATGYGFGLGFAVRTQTGIAELAGTTGDYNWGGAFGTYFWVDPREQMVVVYMSAAPGEIRTKLRNLVKNLVLQAIVD